LKLNTVIAVLLFVSLAFSREYLSQTYIDTTIQSAYYGFIAANRDASHLTQAAAIQRAKNVVADMKMLSEGDPNRRYILWRLSELEAQIGLEEEEVRLKQRYATVKRINELVEIFNKEVLQPRPNFANLHTLHQRMTVVDVSKTNEFAEIINQKNRSVSFNLKQSITNALANNDYVKAETDYNYAVENRKYLNISNSDIEAWRRNIQIKKDADYLRTNIDSRIDFVNGIVAQNRLSEARRHIEVLSRDLAGARALLTQNFVSSARVKLNGLSANIDRREDSLIQHGYSLVREKKYGEASAFLKTVLFPAGVDRNKTAGIDKAIIEAESGRATTYESTLAFQNVSEEGVTALNTAMQERIRAKTDSLRTANEADDFKVQAHFEKKNKKMIKKYISNRMKQRKTQNKCDEFLAGISRMFSQGKGVAAVKKFRSKKDWCFANATPKNYHDVKVLVNNQTGASNHADGELVAMMRKHRENTPEGRRERAEQIKKEINETVSRNNATQAYSLYYFNKSLLDEFSTAEASASVKRAIVRSYIRETGI
jgi:hypothetical protein